MILEFSSSATYGLSAPTLVVLMVEPTLVGPSHRIITEHLQTTPVDSAALWRDVYDNPARHFMAPPGVFSFTFEGSAEVTPSGIVPDDAFEHPLKDLPPYVLLYTLPSRYCQSDMLVRLAFSEFGDLRPNGHRVNLIAKWIRDKVEYQYGTTTAVTSAYDTVAQRVGVCRDFAHLLITFCRALNIPARYVSGYCLDLEPPDFHAWAQVYLSGEWHNVDATFPMPREALLPIAMGRDAADVAIATIYGSSEFQGQTVIVKRAD